MLSSTVCIDCRVRSASARAASAASLAAASDASRSFNSVMLRWMLMMVPLSSGL